MNLDSDRLTGHDLLLAIIGAVAVVLVVPALLLASHVDWWVPPVDLVAALFVFGRRDSVHGLIALAAIALMWIASGAGVSTPWSLVVAFLMFVAHGTLALRTTIPPRARLDRLVVTRWLRRGAAVMALTAAVYLLVFALRDLGQADAEIVLAAALVILGALILLLRAETLDAVSQMTQRAPRRHYGEPPAQKMQEYL